MRDISLHETKRNADSEIVCGKQTFKVHSFLLWSRSEFFNALYNGNFGVSSFVSNWNDRLRLSIGSLNQAN